MRYGWRVGLAGALLAGASWVCMGLLYRFEEFPEPALSLPVFAVWLLLPSLGVAAALAYPTVRSRWSGTQLMAAVFVAHFGVYTFISQSWDRLVTRGHIAAPLAVVLTAHGFLVALFFSLALVLLMGRMRAASFVAESGRLHIPLGEWLWKTGASCICWVSLYIVLVAPAGRFPTWQNLGVQTVRALLLLAFVLPVIKMLKGGRLEAAVAVALMASVLGAAAAATGHGVLGDWVRAGDVARVGASNLIHGLLVGYLFSREPSRV